MKKLVIERNLTGAVKFSADEMQAIAITFFEVIGHLTKSYYWIRSLAWRNSTVYHRQ